MNSHSAYADSLSNAEVTSTFSLIEELRAEVSKLDDYLQDKSFIFSDEIKRYTLCFAAQCLDFGKGLVALHDNEANVSQLVVLRSLLEAYVRLAYLGSDTNREDKKTLPIDDLKFSALEEEIRGLKNEELSFEDSSQKLSRIGQCEKQLLQLSTAGATKKNFKSMLEALSNGDGTQGWYPIYQTLSGKTHSRITDFDRTYRDCKAENSDEYSYPAIHDEDDIRFIFSNARKMIHGAGCVVATVWDEAIA
jgi:hypothetical protein